MPQASQKSSQTTTPLSSYRRGGNRGLVSYTLDRQVTTALATFCAQRRVSKSSCVEAAIVRFLADHAG